MPIVIFVAKSQQEVVSSYSGDYHPNYFSDAEGGMEKTLIEMERDVVELQAEVMKVFKKLLTQKLTTFAYMEEALDWADSSHYYLKKMITAVELLRRIQKQRPAVFWECITAEDLTDLESDSL